MAIISPGLAYYGEGSRSIAFIRLAGIYDPERPAAKRFVESAKKNYSIDFPWRNPQALETWRAWWEDKEIARGQTPSEMFLWSVVASQVLKLDSLLQNAEALAKLNCRFNRAIDEALDACCAQLRYQDLNAAEVHPLLMPYDEIAGSFFSAFQTWLDVLIAQKGVSLPVSKHRIVASIIGAAYASGISASGLSNQHWTNIVEFVRRPQDQAKKVSCEWPVSKGRWDGKRGYRAQLEAASQIVQRLVQ